MSCCRPKEHPAGKLEDEKSCAAKKERDPFVCPGLKSLGQLTEEVVCESRVHLPDGGPGVPVVPVLLAVGGGLADDALDLLELGEVDVAVAVQVEHAESDLELPPGKKGKQNKGLF